MLNLKEDKDPQKGLQIKRHTQEGPRKVWNRGHQSADMNLEGRPEAVPAGGAGGESEAVVETVGTQAADQGTAGGPHCPPSTRNAKHPGSCSFGFSGGPETIHVLLCARQPRPCEPGCKHGSVMAAVMFKEHLTGQPAPPASQDLLTPCLLPPFSVSLLPCLEFYDLLRRVFAAQADFVAFLPEILQCYLASLKIKPRALHW